MMMVYQSRIPSWPPMPKSVHRGRKKRPLAPRGTPRTTLPSAAPRKTVSRALETKKMVSQNRRHTGASTWWRNSREMPRPMSIHSTSISGR